jgi:hypothetical protein
MVFLVLLLVFLGAALVTAGLVYQPRSWRVAMGLTTVCALLLAVLTARYLLGARGTLLAPRSAVLALALATLPYGAVLLRLTLTRLRTPRHEPGPDDDPILRRYLHEKVRRSRKRRQEEELLESSGDPMA